ncbi:ROK family protein [Microbacterium sp.]|uniref:ROK family protein n=1 Tax=Microbacterium sp. TaxID=51671 RepID=UPI003F6F0DAF
MIAWALALDIGGTKAESALVGPDGSVLAASRSRRVTGRDITEVEFGRVIGELVDNALDYLDEDATLLGGGVASAGPISLFSGAVSPLNLPRIRDFDVVSTISHRLSGRGHRVPVVLRGDGAAIVLAERWKGAGRGIDNLMSIVVSTGIGAGIIADGRLVSGHSGNAAHLGAVEVSGIVGEDTYGAPGTLEAIASGPHTVSWAQREGWAGDDGTALSRAYAASDPVAVAAVQRTGRAIGQAVCSAAAMFDLELVTVGGGFSNVSPDLLTLIREPVARHHFPFVRALRVERSPLLSDGPLIGAAALVHRKDLLPTSTEKILT